jgi:hypothetical protein
MSARSASGKIWKSGAVSLAKATEPASFAALISWLSR